MIEEIQKLRAEMEALKLKQAEQPDDDQAEVEETEGPGWADILGHTAKVFSHPGAQAMLALMPDPPSLEMLKHSAQTITRYQNVPPPGSSNK